MTAPRLVAELLQVRRGHRAVLHGVSFTIVAGEILGLLGPNGAGKSTLMDAVTGRLALTGGNVRVDGHDLREDPRVCRRRIGYAGQEVAVFPTLTVTENVAGWAAMTGVPRGERRRAVRDVLEALQLEPLAGREVRRLSGGEQRRVHCAMAVVSRPPVLLLDEPTVGVDPHTRAALLDYVRAFAASGRAVLYSTHYLHEMEKLGSQVLMLEHGRVVAEGTVAALISRHCVSVAELRVQGPDDAEPRTVVVPLSRPEVEIVQLLESIAEQGIRLLGLQVRRPTLEDAFSQIIARAQGGTES